MTAVELPAPKRSSLDVVLRARELGIVLALVLLVAVTTISNPRFLSGQSIRDILLNTAILAVLAVGQAVVVITRNIDLSVGSVLGLSAFTVGTLLQNYPGIPVVFALLVGAGVGAACGVLNGVLVRYGNVPALVVTLGTLYVIRGVTYFWAGGSQINADELPPSFLNFGTADIPWLVILAVVVLVVTAVVLRSYRTGRELYAMGSSPQAAQLAGIPVGRRTIGAFVVSGGLAGLAGVLFAARFGTIDAAAGTGMELNVVAAVVVGGVAVFGGSGTVWGAALGALLLTTIGSALAVLEINQFWQQAIVGGLILLAIGADRLVAVRVAAGLKKRGSHVG
ncbi:ABC transporter permease [Kribbella sandramycini]|uniref:Autoinducer 2 import system permease protein LsrC n=1 Tax=Kribbella sandramycini TaxID=60450 RepID=A0A7Y4NZY0_9ACTN|nr:ABC transporter permease [Kribbella sandramycini]MBB6565802.1 rhamnose transport system permease protein [Kribbella sandramycini]NOL42066.1 ABC transporter permease [Kribbella sandramycini]